MIVLIIIEILCLNVVKPSLFSPHSLWWLHNTSLFGVSSMMNWYHLEFWLDEFKKRDSSWMKCRLYVYCLLWRLNHKYECNNLLFIPIDLTKLYAWVGNIRQLFISYAKTVTEKYLIIVRRILNAVRLGLNLCIYTTHHSATLSLKSMTILAEGGYLVLLFRISPIINHPFVLFSIFVHSEFIHLGMNQPDYVTCQTFTDGQWIKTVAWFSYCGQQ